MNLIADKTEFENFLDLMPNLADGEVYFVSLSARNKYLTEDERKQYSLSKTEMFLRTIIRSKAEFERKMVEIGASLDGKRTKSGLLFPEKAMVVYVNINPSNTVKASVELNKTLTNMQSDLTIGMLSGKQPSLNGFTRLDRLVLDSIQKATGQRYFLDIDLDSTEPEHEYRLSECLSGVEFYKVRTKGGVHFLVVRQSLNSSKVQLHQIVKELDNELKPLGKECMFNTNAMIPMPGTLQAGKLVTLV